MIDICPKCKYQRQASDERVHRGICPRCGIAYSKYTTPEMEPAKKPETDFTVDERTPFFQSFLDAVLYVPTQVERLTFYGRVVLFVAFVLWGFYFITGGISWERIGSSFLHNVNLPFHEFGHVLFGIFGRFMAILGGSLFQVLFPLVFVVAFSWKYQDNFAASITLWWCGQNFIDVSPYIADAPYRAIPLIRGMGENAHDWGNLLTMTHSLESAGSIAAISFAIGVAVILLSNVWGAWLLWKQFRQLDSG